MAGRRGPDQPTSDNGELHISHRLRLQSHRLRLQSHRLRPQRRPSGYRVAVSSLAERLGRSADARLLVVTASGLGCCHAMNDGVYGAVRDGVATGASLQVPAPWAREAAARYRGEDVGVQLTLNAEFELYRWAPLTHAPSLHGGDGGFPETPADLWDHADTDEVRRECRAQIERAILWGFDVTHISTHLDAMVMRPELFDVYLEMAVEFQLPVRLTDDTQLAQLGFPVKDLAAADDVLFVDRVVASRRLATGRDVETIICNLDPGVTEIQLAPAVDRPELHAITDDWSRRVSDFEALTDDAELRMAIERCGVELISYGEIRDLQRA